MAIQIGDKLPSFKATNFTEINEAQEKEVAEFLNELDDNDDTYQVHASVEFKQKKIK